MRKAGLMVAVAAVVAVALAVSGQDAPGDLVVHEWGTFTSMQGSDGVTLEGLQHEEEGLPSFVYSRTEVRECPLRDRGYKGLEVPVSNVTEKMETPVTYFYSPTARRVRVRVCFNKGLLTQWYPVSDLLGPREGKSDGAPLDMSKVEKSFLEWEIDVLPPGKGADDVPSVGKSDPWAFARIPDSNVVRTVPRERPRLGPTESEKFLFYRGLGRFTLPIRAETARGARITLSNGGDDPIRHVFAIHVRDGRGAFSYAPEVPARGSIAIERPLGANAPTVADMVKSLMPTLEQRLVETGLTEKEAHAMALTWGRSYFHAKGLRVLYIVPEKVTNAILPIAISPAPKSIVRVLVGRLECIAPEAEEEVERALRAMDRKALDRLGRFLEPHVRRVLAITKDETVRKNGEAILKEIER